MKQDDLWKRALDEDPALTPTDDAQLDTVRGLVRETYRMRHRTLLWVSLAKTVFMFALTVFAVVGFLGAESVKEWVGYAALACMGTTGTAMMAVGHLFFVHRNALVRELKRVELQLAALAAR